MARLTVPLLVAVVAFLTAGAGTFAAARADAGGLGPTVCSDGGSRCIPGIPGDAVIELLIDRGFDCEMRRFCRLGVGTTSYEAEIVSHEDVNDLIYQYALDVRHDPALELSQPAMAFLTWFAVLPFGNDPEAEDVSREWVTEHVGGDHEITIREFAYTLASPEPGHVRLTLEAVDPNRTPPGTYRNIDGEIVPFARPPQPDEPQRD